MKGSYKFVAVNGSINTADSVGQDQAAGLLIAEAYYWDLNDRTRAWGKRYEAATGLMPANWTQAGAYGATLHYLKALKALAAEHPKDLFHNGAAAVAEMKVLPSDDDVFGKGLVRADGLHIHNQYLFEVKTVAASKSKWDLFKLIDTIPGDQSAPPLSDSKCPLVKAATK